MKQNKLVFLVILFSIFLFFLYSFFYQNDKTYNICSLDNAYCYNFFDKKIVGIYNPTENFVRFLGTDIYDLEFSLKPKGRYYFTLGENESIDNFYVNFCCGSECKRKYFSLNCKDSDVFEKNLVELGQEPPKGKIEASCFFNDSFNIWKVIINSSWSYDTNASIIIKDGENQIKKDIKNSSNFNYSYFSRNPGKKDTFLILEFLNVYFIVNHTSFYCQNISSKIDFLDYSGSGRLGESILLRCNPLFVDDKIKNVSLNVGYCDSIKLNCESLENYKWEKVKDTMYYNSFSGMYEKDIFIDGKESSYFGAVCKIYNRSGFLVSERNSLSLFTVKPMEKYPTYPNIENCRNINSEVARQFCYSDVAEIKDNITICDMIKTPDIYFFCKARINIEEDICISINEEELKISCLDSIKRKKYWLGLE